jgi:hypothetical protein
MAKQITMSTRQHTKKVEETLPVSTNSPLWELGIKELSGKNLETAGREEVNEMLASGWILLHIYTLKYKEGSIWRERPMAILGRS